MVLSSPIVALTTGSDSRNAPVIVTSGFVALAAADVGFTLSVVDVPTNAFRVA
jgi:hypothetical protein